MAHRVPGLAIFFTVFAVNFVGDGLRDAIDPRHPSAHDRGGCSRSTTCGGVLDPRSKSTCARSTVSRSASTPGERVALVGESGSGKTLTALAIMGLVDPPGYGSPWATSRSTAGRPRRYRRARVPHGAGRDVAMVFQDPMTALNPAQRIGAQVAEAVLVHDSSVSRATRDRARHRAAGAGRARRPRDRRTRLPAPALRRDAPAGAASPWRSPTARRCSSPTSRPPRSTSPRRARSSSCSTAAAATRPGGGPRHPRSRRRRRPRRPRRGDVRGQGRGGGPVDDVFAFAPAPVHARCCSRRCPVWRGRGPLPPSRARHRISSTCPTGVRSIPGVRVLRGPRSRGCVPPCASWRRTVGRPASVAVAIRDDAAARGRRTGQGVPPRAVERRARGRRREFVVAPGETLGLVGESGSGKSTIARLRAPAGQADIFAARSDFRRGRRACRSCSRTRTRRSIPA